MTKTRDELDADLEAELGKAHSFAIDDLLIFDDGASHRSHRFVARCTASGCGWTSGRFKTRARAVSAVRFHQLSAKVAKL